MDELKIYQEKWIGEGRNARRQGQRASRSRGGTLRGGRGGPLGVPLFFFLAPFDKTSSFVILSLFSLHSPGGCSSEF